MTPNGRGSAAVTGILLLAVLAGCGKDDPIARGTAGMGSSQGHRSVTFDVTAKGDDVTGTIDIDSEEGSPWSIDVHCRGDLEGALVLGGDVSHSSGSSGEPRNGSHVAIIVKEGRPDRMALWGEDGPPADTCAAFLAAIPTGVVTDLQPVEGDIRTQSAG
jgi:hypothetical protein